MTKHLMILMVLCCGCQENAIRVKSVREYTKSNNVTCYAVDYKQVSNGYYENGEYFWGLADYYYKCSDGNIIVVRI